MAVATFVAGWSGARGTAVVGLGFAGAWVTASALIATDVRDVDGFMDCWPECTRLQDAVGFTFFAGPVMFVVLLVGSFAGWLRRRMKR